MWKEKFEPQLLKILLKWLNLVELTNSGSIFLRLFSY